MVSYRYIRCKRDDKKENLSYLYFFFSWLKWFFMLLSPNMACFLDLKYFLAFLLLVQGSTPNCVTASPEEIRIEKHVSDIFFRFFPPLIHQVPVSFKLAFRELHQITRNRQLNNSLGSTVTSWMLSDLLVSPILICALPSFSSLTSFRFIPGQCPKLPKFFLNSRPAFWGTSFIDQIWSSASV